MFGKILYISDNKAIIENKGLDDTKGDLLNLHLIFEHDGQKILGEIVEIKDQEIEDVWFGEKYAKYRKEIMESRVKISTCKYCNAVDKRKLWGKGEM